MLFYAFPYFRGTGGTIWIVSQFNHQLNEMVEMQFLLSDKRTDHDILYQLKKAVEWVRQESEEKSV